MLYISAMDQARKLKFSSYVHLPSINKMFQYRTKYIILHTYDVHQVNFRKEKKRKYMLSMYKKNHNKT